VDIPKCAVAFGAVTPPQGDVVDLRIHLGCTKEVSSFELILQNWDEKYSPGGTTPINVGMDGHIDVGRSSNIPQLITCRVESVKCESPNPEEHYITVSGRCWGEKLFRRIVTKKYTNQKGEAIVKDLIDNYVGLSHTRDSAELIQDTSTTYTSLDYEDTPVWDIIKYIAESADKDGVIGFDFIVAPDGKFEFFVKNSRSSLVDLTEKIEVSEYRKDIHRIRNKIMIYGLADKSVPLDKDAWTESLTPEDGAWSSIGGEPPTFDTTNKVKGTGSIKVHGVQAYYEGGVFTLNAGKEVNANLYPILSFFAALQNAFRGDVDVSLWDMANKAVWKHINIAPGEWRKTDLKVGLANEGDWIVDPGFDWTQIKKVRIDCWFSGVGSGYFWIDALYFGGRRYAAVREDIPSQNAYGLRELSETDEELVSDNECDLRAKALLDYFKDPAEYLTLRSTVIDYGLTPSLPADKIHVHLPNENVDSDFRIESVEYNVDAKVQTLEVIYELGKIPPQLADYLYGLRATTVTVEKLARTKLGKKGIPSVNYGGGMGAHHSGHETGDETGAQWPSEDEGGWDKITGWISPKFLGPFDDDSAIMKFRTKNKAASVVVDHQFDPSDDEHGVFGSESLRWKETHSMYGYLYNSLRLRVAAEANAKALLDLVSLQFGPGGDVAPDTYIKRLGDAQFELRASLFPDTTQLRDLGSTAKTWRNLWLEVAEIVDNVHIRTDAALFVEGKCRGHFIPDTASIYDLGSSLLPWNDLYLGGALKKLLGGVAIDLLPDAAGTRDLGSSLKSWADIWGLVFKVGDHVWIPSGSTLFMDGGLVRGHLIADTQSIYDLGSSSKPWRDLYLGGALKQLLGGVAVDLLPDATDSRDLGSTAKVWSDIWAMRLHVGDNVQILDGSALFMDVGSAVHGNLIPDADATYDLGSDLKKWSNLYVNGLGKLGWLSIGGYVVITSARVLENVTAAASIITSGRFPLARLPEGTLGYILEAQGAGFDPMYVNPNGRYTPAGHNHAAGNITSGVLDEARCPNVYSGQIHFNGGIVTNSVNCANFSATDVVFENDFRITEAEKLGFPRGLAFLNPKGKVLMFLDGAGNIEVFGKIKQQSSRLKRFWQKVKGRFGFAS
jgi:hypothetical protein